ncbi:Phorbol-ester/DAG-type domain-containing protein [Heracleum sosnowskyi]|uniref:Phorbol-ester/DAG-type domain-containing protein n=1 Tax=Heracleum sosnowskyi TaxID=360622 RepID=A0AAD8IIQ2_9APIA|nr:Phorbol-ester/DAG-type domain-containing protein [Heracleum sosnowskyi]
MGELIKHFCHEHKLILSGADESVVGKDVECVGCRQTINKLIDAFYRCNTSLINGSSSSDCAGFFMHKTCSELPPKFTHPVNPQHPLSLLARPYMKQLFYICDACECQSQGFMYGSDNHDFFVCLECVTSQLKSLEDRSYYHPGHNHPLTLVQSPALFLCHACNTTDTDLSYICTKCCFWIHKSCANAPITYQCKFHNEHTLILDYSLPQEYRKFGCRCSICDKPIIYRKWVYYCANCRFFAHVKCASLNEILSENEIDDEVRESNLMHFPAHDEASLHEMMQQCIMKATDALLHDSATAEPSPYINHWGHKHQLALRNKNAEPLTLDLNWKLANAELLICDGCTKPISFVDILYECNSCNFVLHRSCAHFPKWIDHHLAGKLGGTLAQEGNELAFFYCQGCGTLGNGISMSNETVVFHLGCASLPRIIKHEAHRHPLEQLKYPDDLFCKACLSGLEATDKETIMYGCEKCEFYIHIWCAFRPHLVKHRWDPHPLYLILFLKNVTDHPHEFNCEFCSEQINANTWFYHCNVCDQSYHTYCIDPSYFYSNIKCGATNIYSDSRPHSHGLTLAVNKKKQRCKICGMDACNCLVLECSPCKYMVHVDCY